jgi:hypothetical protein
MLLFKWLGFAPFFPADLAGKVTPEHAQKAQQHFLKFV